MNARRQLERRVHGGRAHGFVPLISTLCSFVFGSIPIKAKSCLRQKHGSATVQAASDSYVTECLLEVESWGLFEGGSARRPRASHAISLPLVRLFELEVKCSAGGAAGMGAWLVQAPGFGDVGGVTAGRERSGWQLAGKRLRAASDMTVVLSRPALRRPSVPAHSARRARAFGGRRGAGRLRGESRSGTPVSVLLSVRR